MASKEQRKAIREKHPDSWVAVDDGDNLIGEVVDATEAWSDARTNNGKNPERGWYPLLTVGQITEATGYPDDVRELKVHAFGSVLFNEVMRHKPDVGEVVHITYVGTGEAKRRGLNPPEIYNLRVAGRTDQAKRAYDRIEQQSASSLGASQRAAQPAPETLPDAEDIPF